MENWIFYAIFIVGCTIAFFAFAVEKRRNEKNLKKLTVRVNVNGIRGKSTITRLITAILKEAGYHVVGKTTGTAARMIYWNKEEEEEIIRKPRGVSIGEQIRVINKAVKAGADALVCECMAVRPAYQNVYQHEILKGDIVAIVNVLEDHLEEMGPTLNQLAWAFGNTIPYQGTVVVPDCEYTPFFQEIAKERNTKLIVAEQGSLPEGYLDRFSYKIFENNCIMALSVARALGIDDETAFRGMLKANPDPGALRIEPIVNKNIQSWLVNAFAANEPASTLEIWECLAEEHLPMDKPIVVMNCRPDRVDRTYQFAHDCLPLMGDIQLVVIGEKAEPIDRAYHKGKIPNASVYMNLSNKSARQIISELTPMLDGHVLFCIGNIHGVGEEFLAAIRAITPKKVISRGKTKALAEADESRRKAARQRIQTPTPDGAGSEMEESKPLEETSV